MGLFLRIWIGQFFALVGTGTSAFSLNLWILQETGSIARFTLAFFFTSLPCMLLSPLSGVCVDRRDRRTIMLACDTCSVVITSALLMLELGGELAIWHVYLAMILQSAVASLRWPAYQALTATVAPTEQLQRAVGMGQLAEACNYIFSPALAGALLPLLGLSGVLTIDACLSFVALATLISARSATSAPAPSGQSLLADIRYAFSYLHARPGLKRLLGYFAGMNFGAGFAIVLATPLLLSFTTQRVMGQVLSISATGMLAGSIVMIALKRNQSPVRVILCFSLISGVAIGMSGLRPDPVWFAAAGFLFFFSIAAVNAGSQALWLLCVEPAVQGRVFAARRALAMLTQPLAYLLAGPLAEAAEAAMHPNGSLAELFGGLLGVGQGRGIALIFVCIGVYIALLTQVFLRNRSLQSLEPLLVSRRNDAQAFAHITPEPESPLE